jgi:protein gp37
MAEKSAISWTKSTFNPWLGCSKIGPGCDHCYAAVSTPVRAFGIKWGAGEARKRTSVSNWNQPLRWNKQAPESEFAGRKGFWPVFCASLADVFDNEVPPEWRDDLWALIKATPNLTWLLVTKRIGNVAKMMPAEGLPRNVWLLITVVNQEEADRDVPKLLAIDAVARGISYEPALGPISWRWAKWHDYYKPGWRDRGEAQGEYDGLKRLDWIIIGGESNQGGAKAREFDLAWACSTVVQCEAAGVAVFVKQLGSTPFSAHLSLVGYREMHLLCDRAGADPAEWPEALRVQQFPVTESEK